MGKDLNMNILILGSGAREHAIAWKLAQSSRPLKLFVAPGNPGTAETAVNLPVDPLDFEEFVKSSLQTPSAWWLSAPRLPWLRG